MAWAVFQQFEASVRILSPPKLLFRLVKRISLQPNKSFGYVAVGKYSFSNTPTATYSER